MGVGGVSKWVGGRGVVTVVVDLGKGRGQSHKTEAGRMQRTCLPLRGQKRKKRNTNTPLNKIKKCSGFVFWTFGTFLGRFGPRDHANRVRLEISRLVHGLTSKMDDFYHIL